MSGPPPQAVTVSLQQRLILERLVNAKKTGQQLAERCRIVLMCAAGISNKKQSDNLHVDRQRVKRWRKRWAQGESSLRDMEEKKANEHELEVRIVKLLSDNYRSGTPAKFNAEQVAQILAIACESPQDSGLPISHWTPADLTREILKRGLVNSISPRQVDRFLKGGTNSPSQNRVLDEAQRKRSRTFR
jgi:putative transposase